MYPQCHFKEYKNKSGLISSFQALSLIVLARGGRAELDRLLIIDFIDTDIH